MDECLKNAQRKLRIHAVNLKESKISISEDIDIATIDRDKTMIQGFRTMTKVKEFVLDDHEEIIDYRFIYSIGLRIIFSDEKEESQKDDYKPALEIIGNFEAQYFSNITLNNDELRAYAAQNVGYHVWPYWREYVQSSCARIGFSPSLEVPVYIINQENKNGGKKTKAKKKIASKKK